MKQKFEITVMSGCESCGYQYPGNSCVDFREIVTVTLGVGLKQPCLKDSITNSSLITLDEAIEVLKELRRVLFSMPLSMIILGEMAKE